MSKLIISIKIKNDALLMKLLISHPNFVYYFNREDNKFVPIEMSETRRFALVRFQCVNTVAYS